MTQEEKVRAYDEALSVALETYKTQPMYKDWLEKMFPELRESDDDKIRKALIEMVHDTTGDSLWVDYNVHKEDAIAWLEKQANHANFRNKIQIGDKVTRNEDGVLVNLSQLNRVAKPAAEVEPKFHEGDIIKPKDGGHEPWQIMQVDIFDKKYRFKDGYVVHFSQEDAYELVEQKPTDEEIKELLRTEYEKGRADAIAEIQKPTAWSEEDERIISALSQLLKDCELENNWNCVYSSDREVFFVDMENWLKSLKDRMQPQNLTITDEELAQAKKDAYNDALDKIEYHSGEPTFDDGWSAAIWYLKKRNALPQSQWKPSDEQMVAIDTAINVLGKGTLNGKQLIELQEQLKKLKG